MTGIGDIGLAVVEVFRQAGPMNSAVEGAIRGRIMEWVGQQASKHAGHILRDELLHSEINGHRLPLIDRSRGIRNPQQFESTLSITVSASGPYDDVASDDGFLHYSYRSGDIDAGDNRKLRHAVETRQPMILFHKETRNIYTPTFPVYAIEDRPEERAVVIAFDESFTFMGGITDLSEEQRRYAGRLVQQRLHQPAFRTRVMVAYRTRCAVCELRYGELLDAAHILPDSDHRGVPTVDNGVALCKIHHVAYDRNMIGLSPDYRVRVSPELLRAKDGPMLKYGLQGMHDRTLTVPEAAAAQPNRDFLAERFKDFQQQ